METLACKYSRFSLLLAAKDILPRRNVCIRRLLKLKPKALIEIKSTTVVLHRMFPLAVFFCCF